ncbi:MAG: 6-carboxytetrahydropterin synthase, partial [Bacteroidales bacterium]|nr:6-carboxytetrahydropterin synthase [Bacteroidales bacterium]
SAAHRLCQPGLSDSENIKLYGQCANPNWHGHNYVLWITVKGKIDKKSGYVSDLKKISTVIRERVVDQLDHKNMNLEVGFMKDIIASTENLAVAIWNELEEDIGKLGVKLHCVKVEETENNSVKYYGE